MDDFNTSTRLRNACDVCHKLKRRCSGAMPCENCAFLGSSCFYSVTGRLGRPRGSRIRRIVDNSTKSPQTQKSGPSASNQALIQSCNNNVNNVNDASNDALSNMLDMDFDSFDMGSMDSTQSPDVATSLFSSDVDALQNIDRSPSSSLSQTTGNTTPLSISAMQAHLDQQQEHLFRQDTNTQSRAPFYQQQQIIQTQPRQSPPSRGSPPPSCQCIPGLSALLHELKQSGDVKIPPAGLDDVLARVNNALTQWSALAACSRCQNHDIEDDDGETLLLAALSIRRVVGQLKAVGCQPGSKGFGDAESEDFGPQLHVGAYQITGLDRTTLLSVLRTITVRKLDAAVTTMQSMLRTKQARRGEADAAMLHHIESMLEVPAKMIKEL